MSGAEPTPSESIGPAKICLNCGYDLIGTNADSRCPECGIFLADAHVRLNDHRSRATFAADLLHTGSRFCSFAILAGLGLLAAVGLAGAIGLIDGSIAGVLAMIATMLAAITMIAGLLCSWTGGLCIREPFPSGVAADSSAIVVRWVSLAIIPLVAIPVVLPVIFPALNRWVSTEWWTLPLSVCFCTIAFRLLRIAHRWSAIAASRGQNPAERKTRERRRTFLPSTRRGIVVLLIIGIVLEALLIYDSIASGSAVEAGVIVFFFSMLAWLGAGAHAGRTIQCACEASRSTQAADATSATPPASS